MSHSLSGNQKSGERAIKKAERSSMQTYVLEVRDPHWRTLVDSTVHDIYHLPEYVRLAALHDGGDPALFVMEEDNRLLLVPLIIRPVPSGLGDGRTKHLDAASPYGYPGPLFSPPIAGEDPKFVRRSTAAFVGALRDHNIVTCFVRLHTLLPSPVEQFQEFGSVVHHGETISIDLSLPSELLWRQMRDDHRRDIKKAERIGQIARVDTSWESLDTFIEIYHDTMRRVDASEYYFFSSEYFRTLKEELGDRLNLCVVEIDGEIAAAGTFTEACGIVQYQFSGTRSGYMHHHPTKTMLHYVTFWAKARDNHIFHLGGGVGGNEDSLFHFKSGFSRLRHPFYTWRIVADESTYASLTEQLLASAHISAEEAAGFFPAYRKPLLGSSSETPVALSV
jgi:Acetyltransferase (GNAT) domain